MNINKKEEIAVTLKIKEYVQGNDMMLDKPLKLYKSEQSYYLDKKFFNYFLLQKNIINDDIDFNKVNIEFYDFHNEEFINQDDDILGEDNSFYIFPPEFLWNEEEMIIQIFINQCPQSYYEKLDKKIKEFQTFNLEKDDLLKQLDNLRTQQENIKMKNEILLKNLKFKELKANIDIGKKQQTC